jgi:hypothetical protein
MKPANVLDPDEPVIGVTGLPILRLCDFGEPAPPSEKNPLGWVPLNDETTWGNSECPLCHECAGCDCEPVLIFETLGGAVPWRE